MTVFVSGVVLAAGDSVRLVAGPAPLGVDAAEDDERLLAGAHLVG